MKARPNYRQHCAGSCDVQLPTWVAPSSTQNVQIGANLPLKRKRSLEDEGTCGCGHPGVRGKAYCPRHLIEARSGTLFAGDA